jgi:hypothetical protein
MYQEAFVLNTSRFKNCNNRKRDFQTLKINTCTTDSENKNKTWNETNSSQTQQKCSVE